MVSRKIKYLIPKDRAELIPMFVIIFIIFVYVLFELCVILPMIYHNVFTYKEIIHLIFGFYIIFNLLGNLYFCLITDTSIDTIICPVLLPAGSIRGGEPTTTYYHCNWRYCHQCETNVPPRSEHCHLCRKCILKRDYHCSFFGKCIGFRNVRYYLCFLIWSWVSDSNRKIESMNFRLDWITLLQYSSYGLYL
jgi:palmitoyltransferase